MLLVGYFDNGIKKRYFQVISTRQRTEMYRKSDCTEMIFHLMGLFPTNLVH